MSEDTLAVLSVFVGFPLGTWIFWAVVTAFMDWNWCGTPMQPRSRGSLVAGVAVPVVLLAAWCVFAALMD